MISIGIDVSKGKSTVCVLKPGGEVLKPPFEMLHTMESILSLVNLIQSYPEEARVVLEDTGHYHWPVVTLLVEKRYLCLHCEFITYEEILYSKHT